MHSFSDKSRKNLLSIAEAMNRAKCDSFSISFYGCGDSGDMESPDLLWENDEDEQQIEVIYEVEEVAYNSETQQFEFSKIQRTSDLETAINEVVDEIVRESHIDWYNGDGGGGHFRFNAKTLEVDFELHYNVVFQETGASFSGRLDIGEVI